MPNSFGLRARTRKLFQQPFRGRGLPSLATYLRNYRVGDIVDIKGVASIHGGMPHKFYHGKTGRVWNVTPRAVGVEINKVVGHRVMKKRIHVRIEHVKPSTCRLDFLKRVRENDAKKRDAKLRGEKITTKRLPQLPRAAHFVSTTGVKVINVAPVPFVETA
eukprot:TRINITY_DN2218_c0_g1::TRINITY_DN2218_c0_g1_i1::g.6793::m.6793 TRINITY_DN2218_c0_g1::TRINITY_DN2218_c0_g1_i1::g.6793  ORF type:complete len:161 (-),score=37.93,sp/Q9FDZ9/RL212_ARATH/55.13/5e-56,Ribosomal_L21e/PF01157.13/2.9e-37 TRINITY_DN2218_c0_g1_i1:110-592(-)